MEFKEGAVIAHPHVRIENLLPEIGKDEIVANIISSLSAHPKRLSSMFFYDETGSKLFEKITTLPEYYIPRTEKPLIRQAAQSLAKRLSNMDIVELGSGDCTKISVLLNEIPAELLHTIRYRPVDVSHSALLESVDILLDTYPKLDVSGVVADFVQQIESVKSSRQSLFCLFGSTLGNFSREEAAEFCTRLGSMMRPGDIFLLGLDMVKDPAVLHNAYNDSSDVTSAFNRNILNVVNTLVGTDFNTNDFVHRAYYNEEKMRMEMHLEAVQNVTVLSSDNGSTFSLKKGETIHTENSHKFTLPLIDSLAKQSGLTIARRYSDENAWFSLVQMEKK